MRKQPLYTTVLIAGTVDGLMGATEDQVVLALAGFVVAMASLFALACRSRNDGQWAFVTPDTAKSRGMP